jgi:hypothetical protein
MLRLCFLLTLDFDVLKVKMDSIYRFISMTIEPKIFLFSALIILLMIYLYFKLTFWKRQGIPNDVLYTYKALNNVLHLSDWNCIKTKGKIIG